ncbi:MAG: cation transporter [Patescibacteria group bacterium]
MNIDFDLEDLDGVCEARTDYVKQTTRIEFDPKKVTFEKITTVISKLGYEAVATN